MRKQKVLHSIFSQTFQLLWTKIGVLPWQIGLLSLMLYLFCLIHILKGEKPADVILGIDMHSGAFELISFRFGTTIDSF